MDDLNTRIFDLEEQLRETREELREIKSTINANTAVLKDFIELATAFKVTFRFFAGLEKVLTFITKAGAAGVLLWAAWKFLVSEAFQQIVKK